MRILIVEDNADSRRLLTKQLKAFGHEVSSAENGLEALALARANPPEIVVTDILMPEMDGYQLCMEWKKDEELQNIPLVFYSAAYTSADDEKFALKLGGDAFIRKPTEFKAFLDILSNVLQKASSGRRRSPDIDEYIKFLEEHDQRLLAKLYMKVDQLEKDIAKRQKTEQALKESEQKYASLVKNGNDIIILNENGLVKYINPRVFEISGFTADEVIGKPLETFVTPDSREMVKKRYLARISGEDVPARYEVDLLNKEGRCLSVEVNASLIKNDLGTIEMAIIRDISERKKSEEALRNSEEKFRQFFENAQALCYLVSVGGIILEVNDCVCATLGFSRDELVGKPLNTIYAPESLLKGLELNDLWARTGLIENEELVVLTRDGQKREMLVSSGAIRGKDGKLLTRVCVHRDITELKESQAKASQVEALIDLNKAKSELLSIVAHELRTPLQSIKGFIETLIEPDVKWNKQQQLEFLLEADKEVEVLNSLIKDLLDISRIESGKMRLEKQTCRLEDILETAKARLTILTARHNLVVHLPPQLSALTVDKTRISQVITNLVENAVKFSLPNSIIKISANVDGGNLIMSVADQGIGMTPEIIEKLFARFYQGEQMSGEKRKGTGLGLSICKGIVEAHQGRIWVESSLGKGSTFYFSLPMECHQSQSQPERVA